MCWLVFRGIRKLGLEGWLLLPAILLGWGDWLAAQFTFLHVPRRFFPFGVSLTLEQITGFLLALALCALLVRRWVRSAQAQRQMTLEMKQAQEVQQVLIPEAVPQISGFSIQSVYKPAGQVGGDFFQILPAEPGRRFALHRRCERQGYAGRHDGFSAGGHAPHPGPLHAKPG